VIADLLARVHKPAAIVLLAAALLVVALVVLLVVFRQLPAVQAFVAGAFVLGLQLPRLLAPKPPEAS
jgi:hypothetical protein